MTNDRGSWGESHISTLTASTKLIPTVGRLSVRRDVEIRATRTYLTSKLSELLDSELMAAQQYGIRAVEIEIDPKMITVAEERARQANVEGLVSFRNADMFPSNISEQQWLRFIFRIS